MDTEGLRVIEDVLIVDLNSRAGKMLFLLTRFDSTLPARAMREYPKFVTDHNIEKDDLMFFLSELAMAIREAENGS